jgi:diadenosine tetraphosphate (Ap4A) HIT family hydrolase
MLDSTSCLFCTRDNNRIAIILENDFCYAFFDDSPVSPGHALIVPKNHVESFFSLDSDQVKQMYSLLADTKNLIQDRYKPDGYNIGINDGEAAGRTIHHLHIHIIPRYKGDIKNPRGGVRHIIPGKGFY